MRQPGGIHNKTDTFGRGVGIQAGEHFGRKHHISRAWHHIGVQAGFGIKERVVIYRLNIKYYRVTGAGRRSCTTAFVSHGHAE
ncbi:hypothetical protein D3C75_472750 [compost metagenome]